MTQQSPKANKKTVPDTVSALTIPVIYILRDHNGQAVTNQAAVEADVKWAHERFAQAGVRITVGQIQTVNSPAGVDLSDGFSRDTGANVTDEQKALFDKYGTAATDDIVIFYINFHDPVQVMGTQTREGQFPIGYPDPQRMNNITMAADHANRMVLSHELLHVLMNSAHDGSTIQHVFHSAMHPVNDVARVRRLTVNHANAVRNSKFVQDP